MRFDRIHQSRIDAAEAAYGLTDDEREVLSLSRRGKSVVAIGMELGMSTRTVSRRRAAALISLVLQISIVFSKSQNSTYSYKPTRQK